VRISCTSYHSTQDELKLLDIDDFAKALDILFQGKATILNRMRLACSFYDGDLKKIGEEGDGELVIFTSLFVFIPTLSLRTDA
jgi:hypothetical protein